MAATSRRRDWAALTERALGFAAAGRTRCPRGCAAAPHGGSAFGVEADGDGRVVVLRQDGWEIVYALRRRRRAPPGAAAARRCRRLEVRIVIDRWR